MVSHVAVKGLDAELAERAESDRPIRIGLIGSGGTGTDIVSLTDMMDGVDFAAVDDVHAENTSGAMEVACRKPGHSQIETTTDALNATVEGGKVGIIGDANKPTESDLVYVVVEATGLPGLGAEFGLKVTSQGKHLLMMNVEADITMETHLKTQAEEWGGVHSPGAGDQLSSCMELAAVANATGLIPDVPGIHGPGTGPRELAKNLNPDKDDGVLSDIGRADYSVDKGVAPGIFVMEEAEHPRIRERMKDLKKGDGPCFCFVRPNRLTSLEVPLTCARVVLHGKADVMTLDKPVAGVRAVAKKDDATGDSLDETGDCSYGARIMEAGEPRAASDTPARLLSRATVTQPALKVELITCVNAEPVPDSESVRLRARQDRMIFGG